MRGKQWNFTMKLLHTLCKSFQRSTRNIKNCRLWYLIFHCAMWKVPVEWVLSFFCQAGPVSCSIRAADTEITQDKQRINKGDKVSHPPKRYSTLSLTIYIFQLFFVFQMYFFGALSTPSWAPFSPIILERTQESLRPKTFPFLRDDYTDIPLSHIKDLLI